MLEGASCLHLSGLQVKRKGDCPKSAQGPSLRLGILLRRPKAGTSQPWQKWDPAGSFWWPQASWLSFKTQFNFNGSVIF